MTTSTARHEHEPTAAVQRITARAGRAALKPQPSGRRAGDMPPDLLVVPLELFLRSEALTHHNLQKDINRLTHELHKALRGIERRAASLQKAHEYITLLKGRLREAGAPIYDPDPVLPALEEIPGLEADDLEAVLGEIRAEIAKADPYRPGFRMDPWRKLLRDLRHRDS